MGEAMSEDWVASRDKWLEWMKREFDLKACEAPGVYYGKGTLVDVSYDVAEIKFRPKEEELRALKCKR
jgi:hypothetical protein